MRWAVESGMDTHEEGGPPRAEHVLRTKRQQHNDLGLAMYRSLVLSLTRFHFCIYILAAKNVNKIKRLELFSFPFFRTSKVNYLASDHLVCT